MSESEHGNGYTLVDTAVILREIKMLATKVDRLESMLLGTAARVRRLDEERELPLTKLADMRAETTRISRDMEDIKKLAAQRDEEERLKAIARKAVEESGQHELVAIGVEEVRAARASKVEIERGDSALKVERFRARWQVIALVVASLTTVGAAYAAARLGIQTTPPPAAKEAK